MNNLGVLIHEYRKKNRLSMRQFADMVGVSQSTISLIENGKHTANATILDKIEEVLKSNQNDESEKDEEQLPPKGKAIKGATLTAEVGKITEIVIKIDAKISDKANLNDKTEEDIKKIQGTFAFESSIIIKTLTEFISSHEEEIKKLVVDNLNKEFEDLMKYYQQK